MLNKTAFSLQRQCGTRWCVQEHSHAWGGAEERRSTVPFPAGTSISRLPSPDLVWEVEIHEFSALGKPPWAGLGAAPRAGRWLWEGQSPQAGYCRWGPLWQRGLTWSSQLLLFLPQRHPVFFYLSQSIISVIIIISLPCLPSQHQPRFSVHRRDSANTKGEMSARCITRFSPNVMWGYRISHHITAVLHSLQCHGYGSLPAPAANLSFQGALCHGYFKHLMQGI